MDLYSLMLHGSRTFDLWTFDLWIFYLWTFDLWILYSTYGHLTYGHLTVVNLTDGHYTDGHLNIIILLNLIIEKLVKVSLIRTFLVLEIFVGKCPLVKYLRALAPSLFLLVLLSGEHWDSHASLPLKIEGHLKRNDDDYDHRFYSTTSQSKRLTKTFLHAFSCIS